MSKLSKARLDAIRIGQGNPGWYDDVQDLLAHIDAMEAELATAKSRTERGDVWNEMQRLKKEISSLVSQTEKFTKNCNKILNSKHEQLEMEQARCERYRTALSHITSVNGWENARNIAKEALAEEVKP